MPNIWEPQFRRLIDLRDRLLEESRQLRADSAQVPERGGIASTDAAADEAERDLAMTLLSTEQDALFEIESALRRLEAGSYGICELTGKRIPLQRLRAIPWTRYTAKAQRTLEKTP